MGWGSAAVDTGLSAVGMIPAYGSAVSAVQTGYHGAATVDALLSGDTEQAQSSGVNTALSAAGMVPMLGEGLSAFQTGWNGAATIDRATGASDEAAPTFSEAVTDWIFD